MAAEKESQWTSCLYGFLVAIVVLSCGFFFFSSEDETRYELGDVTADTMSSETTPLSEMNVENSSGAVSRPGKKKIAHVADKLTTLTLLGRVTADNFDGAPIAGAIVSGCSTLIRIPQPVNIKSTKTDAEGNYRLELQGVEPSRWHIRATADGYADSSVILPLAREYHHNFPLHRKGSASGIVVNGANEPLSGMKVKPKPFMMVVWNFLDVLRFDELPVAESQADGTFCINELPTSKSLYLLVSDPNGKYQNVVSSVFEVPSEGMRIVMDKQGGCTVNGIVVDENDSPVGNAHVVMSLKGIVNYQDSMLTDEQGRFTMRGLPSRQPIDMVAVGRNHYNSDLSKKMVLRLADGETTDIKLQFDPVPPVFDVQGRVIDSVTEEPVKGLYLTYKWEGHNALTTTKTDNDGMFTFTQVCGDYQMSLLNQSKTHQYVFAEKQDFEYSIVNDGFVYFKRVLPSGFDAPEDKIVVHVEQSPVVQIHAVNSQKPGRGIVVWNANDGVGHVTNTSGIVTMLLPALSEKNTRLMLFASDMDKDNDDKFVYGTCEVDIRDCLERMKRGEVLKEELVLEPPEFELKGRLTVKGEKTSSPMSIMCSIRMPGNSADLPVMKLKMPIMIHLDGRFEVPIILGYDIGIAVRYAEDNRYKTSSPVWLNPEDCVGKEISFVFHSQNQSLRIE